MGSRLEALKGWPVIFLAWLIYFALLHLKRHGGSGFHLADNYLTDLMCVPLLMLTSQLIIRFLKNNPDLRLSPFMTLFCVLYISITFEWWLPKLNSQYTSDIWDVLCYAVGGLIFILLNKLPAISFRS